MEIVVFVMKRMTSWHALVSKLSFLLHFFLTVIKYLAVFTLFLYFFFFEVNILSNMIAQNQKAKANSRSVQRYHTRESRCVNKQINSEISQLLNLFLFPFMIGI